MGESCGVKFIVMVLCLSWYSESFIVLGFQFLLEILVGIF